MIYARPHKDGYVTVVESGSNDMVTYDEMFIEIERIPGMPGKVAENESLRHITGTDTENYMLIFYGNRSLLKLNLSDSKIETIEDFFSPPEVLECIPMVAVCTSDGAIVAGLSLWGEVEETVSISPPNDKPKQHQLSVKFKTLGTAKAIEFDQSGKFVFIGGSTKKSDQAGQAIFLASSADKKMKEVCFTLMTDLGQHCVSRIRRVPDSDRLLVATNSQVTVVEFNKNNRFLSISKIKNLGNSSNIYS